MDSMCVGVRLVKWGWGLLCITGVTGQFKGMPVASIYLCTHISSWWRHLNLLAESVRDKERETEYVMIVGE